MRRALLWMACAVTETQRTLFESQSARITLSQPVGDALPHLRLVALPDEPLDRQTIEAVLKATDDLLDSGARFQSSWDLRDCMSRLPCSGQVLPMGHLARQQTN